MKAGWTVPLLLGLAFALCLRATPAGADELSGVFLKTIETDKSVYQPGDEAHILLRLENDSESTVSMYCHSYPGWDDRVYANPSNLPLDELFRDIYAMDHPVWNNVQIKLDMIWTWYFQPGEVFEQPVVWDLTDYYGDPVSPGGYEVLGITSPAQPSDIVDSTNFHKHITIVPEPSMVVLLCGALPLLLRKKIPRIGR